MTRVQAQSDRNFSADAPSNADDVESLRRLLAQNEIVELFDSTARRRFGELISSAILKSASRR